VLIAAADDLGVRCRCGEWWLRALQGANIIVSASD
jgi:hypothetical protein